MLDLVFFEHRAESIHRAIAAGLEKFIVDWELRGKERRQESATTEIDPGTLDDLVPAVSAADRGHVYCRLNEFGSWTEREVEEAIHSGAGCIMLPMVSTPTEVERFLKLVAGRCPAGILVETVAAVDAARDLATFPLERIYVGLNDLAIDRRSAGIFDAVIDGTVECLRETFSQQQFGFGGVTVVDGGYPIPCPLLLAEMERLGTTFSFCRRSFKRDIVGRDMALEVERIRTLWKRLEARSSAVRLRDQRMFRESLSKLQLVAR